MASRKRYSWQSNLFQVFNQIPDAENYINTHGVSRGDLTNAFQDIGIDSVRDFTERSPDLLARATGINESFFVQWQQKAKDTGLLSESIFTRPGPAMFDPQKTFNNRLPGVPNFNEPLGGRRAETQIFHNDLSDNIRNPADLYQKLFGDSNPNATLNDGGTITYTHRWGKDRSQNYNINVDSGTGALLVGRTDRPESMFGVLDYLSELNGSNPAVTNKSDILKNAIDQGEEGLIPFLRQFGARSVQMDSMRYNPNLRTMLGFGRALPRNMVNPETGDLKKRSGQDVFDWLQSTGNDQQWGLPGGGGALWPLQAMTQAMFPGAFRDTSTNELFGEGGSGRVFETYGAFKPKAMKTMGLNEPSGLYLSDAPGLGTARDRFQMPLRMAGQPTAFEGNRLNFLFTGHQVLSDEGEQLMPVNFGYMNATQSTVISRAQASQLQENTLFVKPNTRPYNQQTGDKVVGNLSAFTDITGIAVGSYDALKVEGISFAGDEATHGELLFTKSKSTNTSSNKFWGNKYNTRAVELDLFNHGVDVIAGMPSPRAIPMIGLNALQAQYADDPAGLKNLFTRFATDNDSSLSVGQARDLYNNGVVGGKNAPIWAEFGRQHFLDSATTISVQDRFIPDEKMRMLLGTAPVMDGDNVVTHGKMNPNYNRMNPAAMNAAMPEAAPGLPLLNVKSRVAGGVIADYNDVGYSLPQFVRMRPEFGRNNTTIGYEDMTQMAQFAPGFYNFIQQGMASGEFGNQPRDLMASVRANYDPGTEDAVRANPRTAPIAAQSIDYASIRAEALKGMAPDAPEGLQTRAVLDALSQQYGDRMLQVGERILPSFALARAAHTLNEDNQSIPNYAYRTLQAAEADRNILTSAMLSGGDSAATRMAEYQRDQAGWLALGAPGTNPNMPMSAAAVAESGESMRAAFGAASIPRVGGAAIAMQEVPINSVAINSADLFRMAGARNQDEREQVLQLYQKEGIRGALTQYPHADVAGSFPIVNIQLMEELRTQKGKEHVYVAPGQVGINPVMSQSLGKDFDSDPASLLAGARFMDRGDGRGRQLVTADVTAVSRREVYWRASTSFANEQIKQLDEKAFWNKEGFTKAVQNNPMVRGMKDVTDDFMWGSAFGLGTKVGIGSWYNAMQRQFDPTAFHGIEETRKSGAIRDDSAKMLERSASVMGQWGYQLSIDDPRKQPESMRNFRSMLNSFSFDAGSFNGTPRPGYWGANGKYQALTGDMDAYSGAVLNTIAQIGMDKDDKGNFRISNEDYARQVAPTLAPLIAPMNKADDEDMITGIEGMLNQMRSGKLSPEKFQDQFLQLTGNVNPETSKSSAARWLLGINGDGLGQMSVMGMTVAATGIRRAVDANKGNKYSGPDMIPGAVPALYNLSRGIQDVKGIKYQKSGETILTRLQTMLGISPRVAAGAPELLQQLGFTGPGGASIQDSVQHLNPDTHGASTPVGAGAAAGGTYVSRFSSGPGSTSQATLSPSSWVDGYQDEKYSGEELARRQRARVALQLSTPTGDGQKSTYRSAVSQELMNLDPIYRSFGGGGDGGSATRGTQMHQAIQAIQGGDTEFRIQNPGRYAAGYVDMFAQNRDKAAPLVPVDIKTTANAATYNKLINDPEYLMSQHSSQLVHYAEAASKIYGKPVGEAMVYPMMQTANNPLDASGNVTAEGRSALVDQLKQQYEDVSAAAAAGNPLAQRGLEISREDWAARGVPMMSDSENTGPGGKLTLEQKKRDAQTFFEAKQLMGITEPVGLQFRVKAGGSAGILEDNSVGVQLGPNMFHNPESEQLVRERLAASVYGGRPEDITKAQLRDFGIFHEVAHVADLLSRPAEDRATALWRHDEDRSKLKNAGPTVNRARAEAYRDLPMERTADDLAMAALRQGLETYTPARRPAGWQPHPMSGLTPAGTAVPIGSTVSPKADLPPLAPESTPFHEAVIRRIATRGAATPAGSASASPAPVTPAGYDAAAVATPATPAATPPTGAGAPPPIPPTPPPAGSPTSGAPPPGVPDWDTMRNGGPLAQTGVALPYEDIPGIPGMKTRADDAAHQGTVEQAIAQIPRADKSYSNMTRAELEAIVPAKEMAQAIDAWGRGDKNAFNSLSKYIPAGAPSGTAKPAGAGAAPATPATGGSGAGGTGGGGTSGPTTPAGASPSTPPSGGSTGGPTGSGPTVPGGNVTNIQNGDITYSRISQPNFGQGDLAGVEAATRFFKDFGSQIKDIGEQLSKVIPGTKEYGHLLAQHGHMIAEVNKQYAELEHGASKEAQIRTNPDFAKNLANGPVWNAFHAQYDVGGSAAGYLSALAGDMGNFGQAKEQQAMENRLNPGEARIKEQLSNMEPSEILSLSGKRGGQMRDMAKDMGLLDNATFEDKLTGVANRTVGAIFNPGTFWMARSIGRYAIEPVVKAATEYRDSAVRRDESLMASGQFNLPDMHDSRLGQLLRVQASQQQGQYMFGQQAYAAWQPFMNVAGSGATGQSLIGTMAAIAGPAIGVGGLAAYAAKRMDKEGMGFGVAGAAAATIVGLGSYVSSNTTNTLAIGNASNNDDGGGNLFSGNWFTNPAGMAGRAGMNAEILGNGFAYSQNGNNDYFKSARFQNYLNAPFVAMLAGKMADGTPYEDLKNLGGSRSFGPFNTGNVYASQIPRSTVLAAASEQWRNGMADLGINDQAAAKIQGDWMTYNYMSLPSPQQSEQMASLTLSNVDYMGITAGRAAAQNINPSNVAAMSAIQRAVIPELFNAANPVEAARRSNYANQYLPSINNARLQLGQGLMGEASVADASPIANDLQVSIAQYQLNKQVQSPLLSPTNQPYTTATLTQLQQAATNNPAAALQARQLMAAPDLQESIFNRWRGRGQSNPDVNELVNRINTFGDAAGVGATAEQTAQYIVGTSSSLTVPNYGPSVGPMGPVPGARMGPVPDPTSVFTSAIGQLTGQGFDYGQYANDQLGGRAPTLANMAKIADRLERLTQQGNFDPQQVMQSQYAGRYRNALNISRRSAGRGEIDVDSPLNAVLSDEVTGAGYLAQDDYISQLMQSGSGIDKSPGFSKMAIRLEGLMRSPGTVMQGTRELSQAQQWNQLTDLFQGYGMGAGQAGELLAAGSRLTAPEQAIKFRAAQGDQYALNQLGKTQYTTIDPVSGLNRFAQNVSGAEFGMMQSSAYGYLAQRNGWTAADFAGGSIGIQQQGIDISREQQNLQYVTSQARMTLQQGSLFGTSSIGPQGFATTGGFGPNTAAAYQMLTGSVFQAGNGMTLWQTEDAGIKLQRTQQLFGQSQQKQSLGIQQEQLNLGNQQFQDSWNINRAQLTLSQNQQQWSMNFSRMQQKTQSGWQMEDLEFGRDVSQVQYGFQMRDFDRNIRYATGRDKIQLMQQKQDATVLYSMQQGHTDVQEGRVTQQEKWNEEIFNKQKTYFEENKKYANEEMALQKKYHDLGLSLSQRQLDMAQLAYTKQVEWLQTQFALEDQNRLQQRQQQLADAKSNQMLEQSARAAQLQMNQVNDKLQLMSGTSEGLNAILPILVNNGTLATDVLGKLAAAAAGLAGVNPNIPAAAPSGGTHSPTQGQPVGATGGGGTTVVIPVHQNTPSSNLPTGGYSNGTPVQNSSNQHYSNGYGGTSAHDLAVLGYADGGPISHAMPVTGYGRVGTYQEAVERNASDPRQAYSLHAGQTSTTGYGTAPGFKNQSVGMFELHAGEYVVPQGGTLVKNGGDPEMAALMRENNMLLKQIVDMGPGRVEAHINTPGGRINTLDLFDESYRKN